MTRAPMGGIMRGVIALGFLIAASPLAAAQALNPEFVYGRDYTFERLEATREVHDAQDTGTIRLVSYVYRPVKNDRHEVVLFSHGSTGGIVTSPKEPGAAPPAPVVRFFVSRGYTLVAPQRRGRNESTGTYVEECSVFVGECTVADQLAITDRALQEALLDTYAVIDQVILGRLVPNGKILAAGWSRGGFLSLLLAGERPQLVKGVVNFSGGWHGVTERLSATDNKQRMDVHTSRLAQAAKRTSVPTFWIYAVRDPLYKEGVPQELVRSWRDAGGQAEFVYVTEHTMENAHQVPQNPALWDRQLDAFLKGLAAPAAKVSR